MYFKRILSALGFIVLIASSQGCVKIDTNLGQGYIPEQQKFDVFTANLPLKKIQMKNLDYMSGYSTDRITIGSYRDPELGLTTRSSAFWLSPVVDTIDFGSNTKLLGCHISFPKDTISYVTDNQRNINQNVRVYSLADAGIVLDSTKIYSTSIKRSTFNGLRRVTKGTPVYSGGDSLSFDLTNEFSKEVLDKMLDMRNDEGLVIIDTLDDFIKEIPGLFMCTDDPVGNGGRINMFDLTFDLSTGYLDGALAELKFRADFGNRTNVDTVLCFVVGALTFATDESDIPTQYALNVDEKESGLEPGLAGDIMTVEGGSGLKPVISSKEMRTLMKEELRTKGIPEELDTTVVINKATIVLPFKFPDNYEDMKVYPQVLNPSCRIKSSTKEDYYAYASLTDASISSENQGDVNRSTCVYSPDVSFFTQKVLRLKNPDEETFDNYDIWMLIVANEIVQTEEEELSEDEQWYQQMLYYNYLNSLYGGGYGYGSYSGSSYSNYYSMYYLYSMYNASSSSTSDVETEARMDRDRFYNAKLYGPTAEDESVRPYLQITYSVPRTSIKN